jgi:hypothetical protein
MNKILKRITKNWKLKLLALLLAAAVWLHVVYS